MLFSLSTVTEEEYLERISIPFKLSINVSIKIPVVPNSNTSDKKSLKPFKKTFIL